MGAVKHNWLTAFSIFGWGFLLVHILLAVEWFGLNLTPGITVGEAGSALGLYAGVLMGLLTASQFKRSVVTKIVGFFAPLVGPCIGALLILLPDHWAALLWVYITMPSLPLGLLAIGFLGARPLAPYLSRLCGLKADYCQWFFAMAVMFTLIGVWGLVYGYNDAVPLTLSFSARSVIVSALGAWIALRWGKVQERAELRSWCEQFAKDNGLTEQDVINAVKNQRQSRRFHNND